MPWIMVDVESDGPCPGEYSMISFGAVAVMPGLNTADPELKKWSSFYGQIAPISEKFVPEALAVSGFSREQTLGFEDPTKVMLKFESWLAGFKDQPRFISDNNGFDWQFINYYFWRYLNRNPFGHSSTNLGSLYKGISGSMRKNFKHLRITKHTHNPVDDAKGNVEAFIYMVEKIGLKL